MLSRTPEAEQGCTCCLKQSRAVSLRKLSHAGVKLLPSHQGVISWSKNCNTLLGKTCPTRTELQHFCWNAIFFWSVVILSFPPPWYISLRAKTLTLRCLFSTRDRKDVDLDENRSREEMWWVRRGEILMIIYYIKTIFSKRQINTKRETFSYIHFFLLITLRLNLDMSFTSSCWKTWRQLGSGL